MILRIIGIDFGASSTKIAVKHYLELNNQTDDTSSTQYVRFDNDSLSTPTLIREVNGRLIYGIEAESSFIEGTKVFNNLKEDLLNNNLDIKSQTLYMIKMFFSFLYRKYKEQFSEIKCDKAITYLSIPVTSDMKLNSIIKEAALEAGFPNIEIIYDPSAGVKGIISEKSEFLSTNYYIAQNKPTNILVLDMGASKTSASVCKYSYENDKIELVCSCFENLAGGNNFDRILINFLQEYVKSNGADSEFLTTFHENYLAECIRFKENILIKNLDKSIPTKECSFISSILCYLDSADKPFTTINRDTFQDIFRNYLSKFPILINKTLGDAALKGIFSIDLVFLTGGNSKLFFIKEMILGVNTRFGTINLPKIKNDPLRILSSKNPKYSIAEGLAHNLIKPKIQTEEKRVPKTPLELQVKFKREEDYTQDEKKELLSFITGLDLNKEEYRIIYELYDSKKYELETFIYRTIGYSPFSSKSSEIPERNLSLLHSHRRLIEESGFSPLECMAALKYFDGNFYAAMRNFYASIYIEDEKEFQREVYKMCLSKRPEGGMYPNFIISAQEFNNIKNYYMRKENGLSKGNGVFGTDAYFIFPKYLFQYDKFYKTKGMADSLMLSADKITTLYSLFFSGHISETKYKDILWMHYESGFSNYATIRVKERYKDLSYDLINFNGNNNKNYLQISQEIFKLTKAMYLREGILRAAKLPKDESIQDIVKIMLLSEPMDVQRF